MSGVLHPVGPEHPGVYWRRRVVLLTVVAALMTVLVVVLTGALGDDGAAAAQDAPAASSVVTDQPAAEPAPEPTAAPAAESPAPPPVPQSCRARSLEVAVSTDAGRYGPEALPVLTFAVRNAGSEACTVDLGTPSATELVVVSGSDRIWSTDDCEPPAEARVVTLEPGQEDVQTVPWPRVRSAEDCPGELATPLPGTYQVTGRAAGTASESVAFVLE